MEGREAMSSGGVTVAAEQGGLKSESPNPNTKPSQSVGDIVKAPSTATGLVSMDPSMAFGPMKKKRGRPRKYGPDGSLVLPVKEREGSVVLALTPFSLSAPPGMAGNFSGKRGRGRPPGSSQRQKLETLGEWVAYSAGGNFTPHVIAIAAREDITMKIMSFSQQGPRAICVLAANGVVSSVTLRQPDSSGGTLTYEGRFEILSLSGSFMLTESGGTRSRSGGLSVSLASPDGRVIGGGVAGQLVAASPVQVVVGSFMPNNQEQMKQPNSEGFPHMANTAATAAIPVSTAEKDDVYGTPGQQTPTPLKANHTASSSFRAERWATSQSLPESKSSTDINISLPGG